ncbi:hypothetical protein BDM02DRAFT_3088067 [Thelephora ganbajun]|uniref:Uncharacterized protein n=1 Tax=Thelephora ganbajun TaxID=370292 RepID=A0ACB6ZUS7_THEGA|nr:hypothetical protein BDM02DRAFT_3088067 [Thelephora ganbajun]
MSISLEIVPITRRLELEGEPDGSSAYSLSGHVSVTLRSSKLRRKTVRYLLQSLVVAFDGQTELVTPDAGYTPYRICSVTKELAPQNPVFELNNESLEDSGKPCVWNVIFDLAIPGWLPSSTSEDNENAPITIRYALHATATFVSPEQVPSTSCFTCFASPVTSLFFPSLFPSPRTVRAKWCDVEIARVMAPNGSPIPFVAYTIDSDLSDEDTPGKIPSDILSKIAITASVPEYVDMESNSFELRLRMRTCGLEPLHCKRLRLTEFIVDVQQLEKYRTKPSDTYLARFSLPPESSQPPNQSLLISHPLQSLFTIGMLGTCAAGCLSTERSFSILPKGESGAYQLAGDGYIFATDGDPEPEDGLSKPTWYAVDPMVYVSPKARMARQKMEPLRDWAGDRVFRETGLSPLFTVRHEVRVTLFCTYDIEGDPSNRVAARLKFTLPILFTHVSKRPPVPELGLILLPRSDFPCSNEPSTTTTSSISPYYAHNLPAYSQLFEPNGDRKIDYSLPSYSQHLGSNAIELSTF